ncbi:hypothetical protein ACGF4C_13145 [Streptomyces sp. NPDC048197]
MTNDIPRLVRTFAVLRVREPRRPGTGIGPDHRAHRTIEHHAPPL